MNELLPNGSDGWVAPDDSPLLDSARILFLWHERVKDGRIRVWFDSNAVLHFATEGHPGCTLDPAHAEPEVNPV